MAHPLNGADIGTLARVFHDGGGVDRGLRGEHLLCELRARTPNSAAPTTWNLPATAR